MDAEKKQTARVEEKARTLQTVITIAGFGIGIFMLPGVVIYLLVHRNPFVQ